MSSGDSSRRIEVTWSDPAATAEMLRDLDGLSYLTGMARGRYPVFPAGVLIGLGDMQFEHGLARVCLDPREFHANPMNTMHGGVLATLLDCVLGPAVLTTLPAGRGHTTLTLDVKFTRAVTLASGRLTAEGRVVTTGRRIMTSEGRVTGQDGRIYATGTSTLMIFDTQAKAP